MSAVASWGEKPFHVGQVRGRTHLTSTPLSFYEPPGGSVEGAQKVPTLACVRKHAQESLCPCARACVSIPLFPACHLSTPGQRTSQKCYLVSALTGGSALMSRRPRLSDGAGVCVSG